MKNNVNISTVRNYALREVMSHDECKHAIYGVQIITFSGNIICEIAECPTDIKYFNNDHEFEEYVHQLNSLFTRCKEFNVCAVHKH